MEASITGAVSLTFDAQKQLRQQKRALRVNNEQFFRAHPELKTMCSAFMSALLRDKPDDVELYAEEFFTNPELASSLGLSGWTKPPTPVPDDDDIGGGFEEGSEGEYFDEDELNPEMGGTTEMTPLELEKLLIDLFQEADQDGNGVLDRKEFEGLMQTAALGLSKLELDLLLAEADENADNQITYQEFVPLAVEVIQTMRLKARVEELDEELSEEFRDAAMSIVSMSPEEVSAAVLGASEKLNAGGRLSRAQLKALLKQPSFGISKQQINTAASKLTYDPDGTIAAEQCASQLHEVLIATVAQALQMQNLGEVGAELVALFGHYDKEDTGFLDPKVVKQALMSAFPFATRVQVNALVNDPNAPYDKDGNLGWKEYLPKITHVIKAMGDPSAIRERAELSMRAEFQPVEMMSHLDRDGFEAKLKSLFEEADADGSGDLDPQEFRRCLSESDLGLSPHDIQDLLDAADADNDGRISAHEFVSFAYDILAQLSRERAIMAAMDGY